MQSESSGRAKLRGGPWVNVATVCQALTQTDDGVTLRGLTEGVTIGVPDRARNVERFEVEYDLLIVLTLAGGQPGARAEIGVDTDGDDGMRRGGEKMAPLQFDAQGTLRQPIRLKVDFWGEQRYWFNILLNGRLITRIPLSVRYEFLPAGLLLKGT